MLGISFIILAGILWAVDTLIRYPLLGAGVSAERIVFIEHLFLSLYFIPVLFKDVKKIGGLKLSTISYFLVIGVCGSAIGTLAFTEAFMMINPSLVILMQKLQPVIAISLAAVFLGEKIHRPFLFWAFISLVGGFLISSPDIMPGLANMNFSMGLLGQNAIWGYTLTMVAVVSWGASTVFGKKLTAQGFNETQIMGGRFVLGLVFMFFYIIFQFGSLTLNWDISVYSKILAMVILSGFLGMYFYYKGLKIISARACALAEMFFPFSAITINWIFLDARLVPIQLVGAILLIISSSVIQLKKY